MATEKFHYKHGSKTITLPKFDQLPFGVVRKLRKEDEAEQFFGLIEAVCDDKTLDVVDSLTQPEVVELMEAWQKDAGITAGE